MPACCQALLGKCLLWVGKRRENSVVARLSGDRSKPQASAHNVQWRWGRAVRVRRDRQDPLPAYGEGVAFLKLLPPAFNFYFNFRLKIEVFP